MEFQNWVWCCLAILARANHVICWKWKGPIVTFDEHENPKQAWAVQIWVWWRFASDVMLCMDVLASEWQKQKMLASEWQWQRQTSVSDICCGWNKQSAFIHVYQYWLGPADQVEKHTSILLQIHAFQLRCVYNGLSGIGNLCSHNTWAFIGIVDWNRFPIAELDRHYVQHCRDNQLQSHKL